MDLIPNSGFTFISLLRGLLGMLVLLFIAYLLSNNKKQIAWKTVGLGLLAQVIIAIGVLKIDWVKTEDFPVGEYNVEIYADGVDIGKTKFSLK